MFGAVVIEADHLTWLMLDLFKVTLCFTIWLLYSAITHSSNPVRIAAFCVVWCRCTQIKTYSWDNAQVVLVGNKSDLDDERIVSTDRGRQLAHQLGKWWSSSVNFRSFSLSIVDDIFMSSKSAVRRWTNYIQVNCPLPLWLTNPSTDMTSIYTPRLWSTLIYIAHRSQYKNMESEALKGRQLI